MRNVYYISSIPCMSHDIYHYGVKGMKWGKNIFGDKYEPPTNRKRKLSIRLNAQLKIQKSRNNQNKLPIYSRNQQEASLKEGVRNRKQDSYDNKGNLDFFKTYGTPEYADAYRSFKNSIHLGNGVDALISLYKMANTKEGKDAINKGMSGIESFLNKTKSDWKAGIDGINELMEERKARLAEAEKQKEEMRQAKQKKKDLESAEKMWGVKKENQTYLSPSTNSEYITENPFKPESPPTTEEYVMKIIPSTGNKAVDTGVKFIIKGMF